MSGWTESARPSQSLISLAKTFSQHYHLPALPRFARSGAHPPDEPDRWRLEGWGGPSASAAGVKPAAARRQRRG